MININRSHNLIIRKIKSCTIFLRFAKIWDSCRTKANNKICNSKKIKEWSRKFDNDEYIMKLFKIEFLTTSYKTEQLIIKRNVKYY